MKRDEEIAMFAKQNEQGNEIRGTGRKKSVKKMTHTDFSEHLDDIKGNKIINEMKEKRNKLLAKGYVNLDTYSTKKEAMKNISYWKECWWKNMEVIKMYEGKKPWVIFGIKR